MQGFKVPTIIGGNEVEPHSEPHIVSLQNRAGHFCGASIVSDTWLISAAHCHQVGDYSDMHALLGAHNIKTQALNTIQYSI